MKLILRIFTVSLLFILVTALPMPAFGQTLEEHRLRFALAYEKFEDGEMDKALALFDQLVGYDQMVDFVDYFRLRIHFIEKRYERCARISEILVNRQPVGDLSYKANMYLALAELKKGNPGKAVQQYHHIQNVFPEKNPGKTLYRLGSAYEAGGKYRKAERAWQKVVWLHPASGFSKQAQADLNRMRKKHGLKMKEPTADLLYQTLGVHKKARRTENTILFGEKFLKLFHRDKRRAWVRLDLAEAYLRKKNYTKAWQTLSPVRFSRKYKEENGRLAYLKARASKTDEDELLRALKHVARKYKGTCGAAQALEHGAYRLWGAEEYRSAAKLYQEAFLTAPACPGSQLRGWRAGWGFYLSGNWNSAATILARFAQTLPQGLEKARAHYWAGRAFQLAGNRTKAMFHYDEAIGQDPIGFYAFSAERHLQKIGREFHYDELQGKQALLARLQPWNVSGKPISLKALPGVYTALRLLSYKATGNQQHIVRVGELLEMDLGLLAGGELQDALDEAADDPEALVAAAVLYRETGIQLEAVKLANRLYSRYMAGEFADPEGVLISLRMPFYHFDLVQKYARQNGLDPYFVMALIRQESVFDPRATSRVGARGLMQIMPRTGKKVARELKLKGYQRSALHDPETSIQMGTYYLAQARDRFGGDLAAALAGYNAGPSRPARWWPENEGRTYDELIENIPFTETRGYVRNILRNYEIYRHWYADKGNNAAFKEPVFAIIEQTVTTADSKEDSQED